MKVYFENINQIIVKVMFSLFHEKTDIFSDPYYMEILLFKFIKKLMYLDNNKVEIH
jgi:hypothetical protein